MHPCVPTTPSLGIARRSRRRGAPGSSKWLLSFLLNAPTCLLLYPILYPSPLLANKPAAGLTAKVQAPESAAIRVVHVTDRAVYLEGGSDQGVRLGGKLEVFNDGQSIALLEVVSVTNHTTYCRPLHSFRPITIGDTVILSSIEEVTVTAQSIALPPPAVPSDLPRRVQRQRLSSIVRTPSLSGSSFFRHQTRTADSGDEARSWTDSTARVSLRGRNLGGYPVSLRIRGRMRTRSRNFDDRTDNDQRFYEFSVAYEPEVGRRWWQVGRLGSLQETGVGFLDGFAGQWGLGPRWGVGGFLGSNPEVDDSLFSSDNTKAGVFVSYRTERGKKYYGEFLLSTIAEYVPGDVSREYAYFQTRIGHRGRWSIYQQAEIDLNRGWREELTDSTYALSNLSLSTSFRLSPRFRAAVSYDARRRFREFETRDIPEERFDELLREGFRTTLFFRGTNGLNVSLGMGLRGGQGDVPDLNSYNVSINRSNWFGRRIFLGLDVSLFQGDESSGRLTTIRARAPITKGIDVGLTIGDSQSSSIFSDEEISLRWARLNATKELPRGLFLIVEAEFGLLPGSEDRQLMQLGYRF